MIEIVVQFHCINSDRETIIVLFSPRKKVRFPVMFDYIAHKVLGLVFFLLIYICTPYMLYIGDET